MSCVSGEQLTKMRSGDLVVSKQSGIAMHCTKTDFYIQTLNTDLMLLAKDLCLSYFLLVVLEERTLFNFLKLLIIDIFKHSQK